uniref:DUF7107 domain-containing protein n=1 Tax=Trichuris muris TaxID=70415 RepID=A0A5S6Q7P2_TRIMR
MLLTVVAVAAVALVLTDPVEGACTKHSDCIGLQMCISERCVPAKPAGGQCTKDSQCEAELGQACISGICMVPVVQPPKPKDCITSEQCPGQRLCVNFKCVPAVPTGKECDDRNKCPDGQTCRYGDCWIPYAPTRG